MSVNIIQSGKGFQGFTFPDDIVYYTRIFTARTNLLIPNNYSGDIFLGAIDRYHKVGQIFFLFEGYVKHQAFLEYTQQEWGCFIPRRDVDLPIFIEADAASFGETSDGINKHLTPHTVYSPSMGIGRLNFIRMIQDILLDIVGDITQYELMTTWKLFAKYKPGLYDQMKCIDQIIIESFREDVVIELVIEGLR